MRKLINILSIIVGSLSVLGIILCLVFYFSNRITLFELGLLASIIFDIDLAFLIIQDFYSIKELRKKVK